MKTMGHWLCSYFDECQENKTFLTDRHVKRIVLFHIAIFIASACSIVVWLLNQKCVMTGIPALVGSSAMLGINV